MAGKLRSPKQAFRTQKSMLKSCEKTCGLEEMEDQPTFASALLSLQNPEQLYQNYLAYCQMAIRHELVDCRPQLELALELAIQAANRWLQAQKLDSEPVHHGTVFKYDEAGNEIEEKLYRTFPKRICFVDFNFSLASLVSLLVRKQVPQELMAVVPKVSAWKLDYTLIKNLSSTQSVTKIPSNYCDSGLLYMIDHGRRPKNWVSILAILDERACLLRKTYEIYGDVALLSHKEKYNKAWDAVEEAHDLYDQRGGHDYNELQWWEGPQGSNHFYADIRLSVLIHHCIPNRRIPKQSPALIHRYKT